MKIILTIVCTTIVILFAIQNSDEVSIFFLVGKPVQARLFLIMVISGIFGYLLRYLIGLQREEEIKKKYRLMLHHQKNSRLREANDFDVDEL